MKAVKSADELLLSTKAVREMTPTCFDLDPNKSPV